MIVLFFNKLRIFEVDRTVDEQTLAIMQKICPSHKPSSSSAEMKKKHSSLRSLKEDTKQEVKIGYVSPYQEEANIEKKGSDAKTETHVSKLFSSLLQLNKKEQTNK